MNEARRRSARISVDRSLPARVVGLEAGATIVELSVDGFRIESPIAFVTRATYEFLVSPQAGQVVRLEALATGSHVIAAEPRLVFETGFAFATPPSPSTQLGVAALIESLTAVLPFD